MIDGLLDQLQPGCSDEEDDLRPDAEFALRATGAPQGQQGDFGKADGALGVSPESCRSLIICGPGAGSAFALSAFSLQPLPWLLDIVESQAGLRSGLSLPKPPRFFLVGGGAQEVVVALLEGPVPAEIAGAWVEALLESLGSATEVLFLDRVFRSQWQAVSGERPLEPYLCGLWTRAWAAGGPGGDGSALAPLPAPNAVEGLAAALLSHCEAIGKRCLLALTLQDGAHLSEGAVRGFAALSPVLEGIGLLPAGWKSIDYREAVRQVMPPASMSIYA